MPYVTQKEHTATRNLMAFLSGLVGASVGCSRCTDMAVELDCFFPYYTDGNRCFKHLKRDHEAESNVEVQGRCAASSRSVPCNDGLGDGDAK